MNHATHISEVIAELVPVMLGEGQTCPRCHPTTGSAGLSRTLSSEGSSPPCSSGLASGGLSSGSRCDLEAHSMTDIFGVWDAGVAEALKTVPIAAKMAASYWKELRSNGLDKRTATT